MTIDWALGHTGSLQFMVLPAFEDALHDVFAACVMVRMRCHIEFTSADIGARDCILSTMHL